MAREYRSDLDGLKGIAILAVVLYHLFNLLNYNSITSLRWFEGGFLGVDVFLLLSGYLITAGIVYKLNDSGFSLKEFYIKRLKRILPELIIICAFCLLAGYFLLTSDTYLELSNEIIKLFNLKLNYYFAKSGGYFAMSANDKVMLHLWYITITLQFYIAYPLILMLLSKLFGLNKIPLCLLILTIVLSGSAFYFSLDGEGYLKTHTRIFEMFIGGTLFVYQDKLKNCLNTQKNAAMAKLVELAGIAFVIYSVLFLRQMNGQWRFALCILPLLGTSLIILAANKRSFIGFWPLTIFGRGSYSIYLWHWPLFIFALRVGFDKDIISFASLLVALSLICIISYKYIEQRNYSIVFCISGILFVLGSAYYERNHKGSNYLNQFITVEHKMDLEDPVTLEDKYKPTVIDTLDEINLLHIGDQTKTPHIFFLGDSHAFQYENYLTNVNKIPMYFLQSCGTMAFGDYFYNLKAEILVKSEHRKAFYELFLKGLSLLSPKDKVVISVRWNGYYPHYLLETSKEDNEDSFKDYMAQVISDLKEQIEKHSELEFYLIEQGNEVSNYLLNDINLDLTNSFLKYFLKNKGLKGVPNSIDAFQFDYINNQLKNFSDLHNNVKFIKKNYILQNSNGLYKVISDDGKPLFFDTNHYTSVGAKIVCPQIIKEILDDN